MCPTKGCACPLSPRLSSNTQKASGALVPMINRTSFSLILGRLMSCRWSHLFASCSDGILRLEALNLSTVHSLLTSNLSVPSSGSTVRLISWPTLGLSSFSCVVRKNVFWWPCTPSSIARFLSHKDISDPLSISAYVSTVLLASCLRTEGLPSGTPLLSLLRHCLLVRFVTVHYYLLGFLGLLL